MSDRDLFDAVAHVTGEDSHEISVIRGPDGRIARIRYVLPRHKAANWIGPGRGRKSTRPGTNGVVELTPFAGRMPVRRSSQTSALAATAHGGRGQGWHCRRNVSSTAWPISSRRRGSTGTGTTGCLRRTTSCEKPSRRSRKGDIGKRRDTAAGEHAGNSHATQDCCDTHAKPRSHDTSRIAWAKLLARVGEEFPLECPACGGDIRLIAFITEPGPIRNILTHLGEPLEPPPVSPARGPPADWAELVQVHDDRDIFQGRIDELPAIDIHSL